MESLWLQICDIQGRLFKLAWKAGYDSEDFMKQFMRSRVARDLDSEYNRMQWAGEEYGFKRVVQLDFLWQLHWQERKDFDSFFFHCAPPNKNRTIHADCPAKVKGEHPKILPLSHIQFS